MRCCRSAATPSPSAPLVASFGLGSLPAFVALPLQSRRIERHCQVAGQYPFPEFPASVSGATSTVQADRESLPGGWTGPFTAVPPGKLADAFEVDIFFPNGLISYNKKGKVRGMSVDGQIQWRELGTTEWQSVP